MFGVETRSFLPDDQSDRGDLARQGESRHVRLHPSGHASFIEMLKRPGCSGSRGCALEDIFQIVVVVAVESANGQDFLERWS